MPPSWRNRFGIGFLLLTAATCSAQEARNPDYDYTPGSNYGPIKWPARRQHLLAGRYIGKIQVQVDRRACPSATADLRLEAIEERPDSRHYTLTYTCLSGKDPNYRKKVVTLRSTWGVDEIAGSCLILQREPDPALNPPLDYPLYGFESSKMTLLERATASCSLRMVRTAKAGVRPNISTRHSSACADHASTLD